MRGVGCSPPGKIDTAGVAAASKGRSFGKSGVKRLSRANIRRQQRLERQIAAGKKRHTASGCGSASWQELV